MRRSLLLTIVWAALAVTLAQADELLPVAGTFDGIFPIGNRNNVIEFRFGKYDLDLGMEYCTAIGADGSCEAASGGFGGTVTDTRPLPLDLGLFRLWRPDPWQPQFYLGIPFQLDISFTDPEDIAQQRFVASLWGLVTYSLGGFVNIDFQQNEKNLSFSTPSLAGTFTLRVNDLSIWLPPDLPCRTGPNVVVANLTGEIRAGSFQRVPEPAAYEILGACLLGAVLFLCRRSSRRPGC